MAGADSSMAMAPDDFVDGNSALFQRRRELQRRLVRAGGLAAAAAAQGAGGGTGGQPKAVNW